MNIRHIIEGIGNSIFVKEEVEKIANERMAICKDCPRNSANKDKDFFMPGKFYSALRPDVHCSMCACNLHAKTRSLHTNCPIDKWNAVASEKESALIAVTLDKIKP